MRWWLPWMWAACGGSADVAVVPPPYHTHAVAGGAEISKVSLFQGVEYIVANPGSVGGGGSKLPMIAGRDGLMRVHWGETDAETFTPRKLAAVVTLTSPSGVTRLSAVQQVTHEASSNNDLSTTFLIDVPGDAIPADLEVLDVALHEVSPLTFFAQDPLLAVWSSEDRGFVNVEASDTLRLVLLPVRYDADGGRLPDTSDAQLALLESKLEATYPVTDVIVTVGEVLPYDGIITANGGLPALLGEVNALRSAANEPPNTYYYGLVSPVGSFAEFCGTGCTTGLSNLAFDPSDAWSRASVGVGFPGEESVDTLIHEVGHAHGRQHAPCGDADDVNLSYPYPSGGIGVMGYDPRTQVLLDGVTYKDAMSYCGPIWFSDYTIRALLDRVQSIAGLRSAGIEERWRQLQVAPDGEISWLATLDVRDPPAGEPTRAWLVYDDGAREEVTGAYYPYSHLGGGMLLVPEPGPGVVEVTLTAP